VQLRSEETFPSQPFDSRATFHLYQKCMFIPKMQCYACESLIHATICWGFAVNHVARVSNIRQLRTEIGHQPANLYFSFVTID
jgi:hypothetical protein